MGYGPSMTGDHCVNLAFSNPEFTNVSISVRVCLDEMPATVFVNLLDSHGGIEDEWQDDEIDVDEITERARELSEELSEEDD
jgi:hypothetical protein